MNLPEIAVQKVIGKTTPTIYEYSDWFENIFKDTLNLFKV